MSKEDIIPVGRVAGAHGIRGEVKVRLYGGADDFPYKTILAAPKGPHAGAQPQAERLTIKAVRRHKGLFLVLFEGYATRTEAEGLTGVELSVRRDELPELAPGEFYLSDLVGLAVSTEEGRDLGRVKGIIPTGASDVLEIDGPEGEFLLPMAGDFIQEVDVDGGRIVVRLMEGLLPGEL